MSNQITLYPRGPDNAPLVIQAFVAAKPDGSFPAKILEAPRGPNGVTLPLTVALFVDENGNILTISDTDNVSYTPEPTGAVSRTAQSKLGDIISVKDFGAKGDGVTDDTTAFQAAFDVVTSYVNTFTSIFIPPGDYRIAGELQIKKRYTHLFGAGDKSCLVFDPPSTNKVMLLVQASDPTQLINYITLENFGFRATAGSAAYKKTGIKLIDSSTVVINRVNTVDYTWTGGAGKGSVGIHMCGRDTNSPRDCVINADQPIWGDINPNSNQYQFDGHTFWNMWMYTLKSSNYAIDFAPGVNPSNWVLGGNSNTYGGKGGIHLDNTSVATAYPASLLDLSFRCESGTGSGGDAGGHGVYMDFGATSPLCGNITLRNCSVNDPTCNGYVFNRVNGLFVSNVNCGFGANNAFITTTVLNATIINLGIGSELATVTFTGMYEQYKVRTSIGSTTTKSIAFGIYTYYPADTPANNLTYRNGVREWQRTQSLANAAEMTLPVVPVGGSMTVTVSSPLGGAIYTVTRTAAQRIDMSMADYGTTTGAVRLVADGAGNSVLRNVSAGTMTFIVDTKGT